MNEAHPQPTLRGCSLAIACWCCLLCQPALAEFGIFQSSDDGETWQLFDGTVSSHSDACTDPDTIAQVAADSTLPMETRLYVANPGSNTNRQTFLRFVNPNATSTSVEVYGIDDSGVASASGALSFTLTPGQSKQITAQDLENGNTGDGLTGHFCDGQGKWRLHVRSDNTVQVMGMIRTPDGFLTQLSDTVPREGNDNLVYFANPASNTNKQTFLRIVNVSDESGTVTITGIDDTGTTSEGTVSFLLGANEAKQITAQDLENGNQADGLTGTLDNGDGKWRLIINSSLDLRVMSLIRTPAGFLTNLSGVVDQNDDGDHEVFFVNPASETERTTLLRVINTSTSAGIVTISGIDDMGNNAPEGDVTFELLAGQAKQITSDELENGGVVNGLSGRLGDGTGRWRLIVSSSLTLEVMSLIRTADGFLTNLSSTAPVSSDGTNEVYLFNPGSNTNKRSTLRIVNIDSQPASITINGTDDNGAAAPGGPVTLNVDSGAAIEITAQDLESGSDSISGALGDGFGKWHLTISTDQDIRVQSLLDTATGFLTNLSRPADNSEDAAAFYASSISGPVIQTICINCHVDGGLAASSALQYTPQSTEGYQDSNYQVLRDYVAADSNNADALLEKPRGVNHGGGVQLSTDSEEYQNLVQFLELLNADIDESNNVGTNGFWEGVTLAAPAQTLRRAALIVAGRLPTDEEEAAVATGSEEDLRTTIRGLMDGEGFHRFLTTGANDRLFTDAFLGNLFFEASDLNSTVFFPRGTIRYFEDQPETEEEELDKFNWNNWWRWGLARAPIELIAYIVMNDRSYQEVLTADYMMVNFMTADILNSEVEFETEDHRVFLPGRNQGQIVRDDQLVAEFIQGEGLNITSHGDFIEYPHAGVLNTHSFLNRYPTTETNRNRARARWTYYHFLGVDIEKSAQRTTDPEALADTNNPTMNNPACTVCHSLHDPVAGTFQNYGNEGFYRDQSGGMDSLPDTYKHPEWFSDDAEPSDYVEGDTWFRDMRDPGFDNQLAPNSENSLQWLGSVIAEDPRFATASVKFWWPALIGSDALRPPEASEDVGFQDQLLAFEAQNAFIESLGEEFSNGIQGGSPFNGRDLLTEIIMSPWFRATALTDAASTTVAVNREYGTDRLLTPLELENKSRELLGWTWGASESIYQFDGVWTNLVDRFRIYYGGIDSDGIRERSRALTPLMANVAERQAITMACPAVVVDFDREDSNRRLFEGIEADVTPTFQARQTFDITPDSRQNAETYSVSTSLHEAPSTINIAFLNDYAEDDGDRNLRLDSLTVVDGQNSDVFHLEFENLFSIEGATAGCGDARSDHFIVWSNCTVSVPFTPESTDIFEIRVVAYGDQAGPDEPIMQIQVDSNDPESGLSMGASRIKDKLVDLHQKLLSETLTSDSIELEESYQLLVETWVDRRAQENNFEAWSWPDENCFFYLEEQWEEGGVAHRAQDPHSMLNTWTSVLIYLMTDFHYLHE